MVQGRSPALLVHIDSTGVDERNVSIDHNRRKEIRIERVACAQPGTLTKVSRHLKRRATYLRR
jgi:hypothetical protein